MRSRVRCGLAVVLSVGLADFAIIIVSTPVVGHEWRTRRRWRPNVDTADEPKCPVVESAAWSRDCARVRAGRVRAVHRCEIQNYAQPAPRTPSVQFVALNLSGGGSVRDLADFGASFGATGDVTYLADPDGTIPSSTA
jgi:hypothetical protein